MIDTGSTRALLACLVGLAPLAACSRSGPALLGVPADLQALAPSDDLGLADLAAEGLPPDLRPPVRWVVKTRAAGTDLHAVWASSDHDLYIGDSPLDPMQPGLLHSTDLGRTWTPRAVEGATAVTTITGTGAKDVYLSAAWGGTIYRSVDGGIKWVATAVQPLDGDYCCDQLTIGPGGVLLGSGEYEFAFASDDHGAHWRSLMGPHLNRDRGWPGLAVSIGTQPTLWLFGNLVMPVSRDLGKTWSLAPDNYFWDIKNGWARSDYEAFAVGMSNDGNRSLVLHTRDAGVTWQRELAPVGANSRGSAIWGFDDDVFVASSAYIAHSGDDGATWSIDYTDPDPNIGFLAAFALNATDAWVVGGSVVLHLE